MANWFWLKNRANGKKVGFPDRESTALCASVDLVDAANAGRSLQISASGDDIVAVNALPTSESPPILEDFIVWITSAQPRCQSTSAGTGAGTSQGAPLGPSSPGTAQLSTGTTATGRNDIGSHLNSFSLGGGAVTFATSQRIPVLSTAAARYQLIIGFRGSNTAINQTNGVYFLYDEGGVSTGSTASPNWQIVVVSNGVRVFTLTSVPVDTAINNFRIEVNANADRAEFFINSASVGAFTAAAQIPSGINRLLGYGTYIQKSIGTVASTVLVDYHYFHRRLTAARGAW